MAVDLEPSVPAGHAEAPATLAEPAPRTLGLFDQFGFWGNVGVSLLGFSGAVAVLPTAKGGSCCRQISCACGQRVWKRQAGGGAIGLGRSPCSTAPRVPAPGTEASSARV